MPATTYSFSSTSLPQSNSISLHTAIYYNDWLGGGLCLFFGMQVGGYTFSRVQFILAHKAWVPPSEVMLFSQI